MAQKKFNIQGKKFLLAPVTPRRLAAFCQLMGIVDFDSLKAGDAMQRLTVITLDVSMDENKVRTALETCLQGDVSSIDAGDVDVPAILFPMINDFFWQLLPKQLRQQTTQRTMQQTTPQQGESGSGSTIPAQAGGKP